VGADFTRETSVEDLVELFPKAIGMLIERGLPCVVCGEPFWGSIAELAAQKGWDAPRIDRLVTDLNDQYAKLH
jgi:hypothetical protein